MNSKLQERLGRLKSEYASGQTVLAELEAKQSQVKETLLRISGAIQVLEEMIGEESDADTKPLDTADLPAETKEAVA